MKTLSSGLIVPDNVLGYTDRNFSRARANSRRDFAEKIAEMPELWVSRFGRNKALKRIAGGGNQPYNVYWPPILTSQTAITGTGIALAWPANPYSAIPPNSIGQGQMLWLEVFGTMTTAATTPGNITITPIWGTTTGGTSLGASAASALTASATGAWLMNGLFTMRTVNPVASSSTGTCIISFQPPANAVVANIMGGGTVVTTLDTSTAQGWVVGATLGAAGDTLQTLGGFMASLN